MRIRGVLLMAATLLLANPSLARACTSDADCNDGNVCNGSEVCAAGVCQPGTPLPTGASCGDSNLCNGTETCQSGLCYPGYPLDCSDGNPSTIEWCDPVTGCRHQLNTAFTRCDEPSYAARAFALAKDRCPCDDTTTHGEHVRCVAREIADDDLLGNCRGRVKRCAARSTCGKRTGFVTCCLARPGWCRADLCQDGATPCSGAADCPPSNRCSLKSSAELCIARGGSPGTGSCCDATCGLP
jgi:hypothetical protein